MGFAIGSYLLRFAALEYWFFWPRIGHLEKSGLKNWRVEVFEGLSVIGGAAGIRTPGLRIANAALCQTELLPHLQKNIRNPK